MRRTEILMSALSLLTLASAPGAGQVLPTLGSIQGRVLTADNKPVPGAEVTASNGAAPLITKSGLDGGFQFAGLAAGTYLVCAQSQPGLLNPCLWSAAPAGIAVTSGAAVTGVVVRMLPAVSMSIRLNDPKQLIPANEGKTNGAYLMIGVWTPAHLFISARVISNDAGGRTYAVETPSNVAFQPGIHSKAFRFADTAGKAISTDLALASVTLAGSVQPAPLSVTVSGIVAQ